MSHSLSQAKDLILELREREISLGRAPETWYTYDNHVFGTAKVAETIARQTRTMAPDRAYVYGLLHDICRTEEDREQRFHGILGYEKLIKKDEGAARQALLHMFAWNELPAFDECAKMFYGKRQDYDFVMSFIKNTQATDMDYLIQLADALANKDGVVTLEARAEEYAKRHGVKLPESYMRDRLKLKAHFDQLIGKDIYELF